MNKTYSLLLYGRLTRDPVKHSAWDPFKNPIAHQEWDGGKVVGFNRLEEFWEGAKYISTPIGGEGRKVV